MPDARAKIEHGARVVVTARLLRQSENRKREMLPVKWERWKVWTAIPMKATGGIFLGWRTLREGTRHYEGEEVGWVFTPKGEPITAALVSLSPLLNPVYVPADELADVSVSRVELVELVASEISDAIAAHCGGVSVSAKQRADAVVSYVRKVQGMADA